jgi:thymidylate kinase
VNITDAQDALEGGSHTAPFVLRRDGFKTLTLILKLRAALEEEGINYCHWKSNEGVASSRTHDNDLDLLIDRNDASRFTEALHRLGFREARPSRARELPGVLHYFGLDEVAGILVHVHAHYQLILGDDTTKNYHLPIEEPYLASSLMGPLFMVPAPEFEFVVFVIRMMLKHATWDSIIWLRGALTGTERRELEDLLRRVEFNRVHEILKEHLPFVEPALFDRCLRCLQTDTSVHSRIALGYQVQRRLATLARRPPWADTLLRLWRRFYWRFQRYALKRPSRYTLVSGGALIAIVGGDGAGKSSVVNELSAWLSKYFVIMRVHLGKPPRSASTMALRVPVVVGRRLFGAFASTRVLPFSLAGAELARFPGKLWLIWHVLTARDRFRAYLRARRCASNGGLVVSDRYPLRQIKMMDGPVAGLVSGWTATDSLAGLLARVEKSYYERIKAPDLLIVLRIAPDIAVERRSDEDEDFVRARCGEVENASWDGTPALVIDASRAKADVLSEIKSLVWARL